jgi:hypothetical protein
MDCAPTAALCLSAFALAMSSSSEHESEPCGRSKAIWLNDGNTVFNAKGRRLFRIYMGLLARKSTVFAALQTLPQADVVQVMVDGCPVIDVDDDPEDFEAFLIAVVDSESVVLHIIISS